MPEVKLLPCPNPWCTNPAAPYVELASNGIQWRVRHGSEIFAPWKMTEAEAIAAWNTRPAEATALAALNSNGGR